MEILDPDTLEMREATAEEEDLMRRMEEEGNKNYKIWRASYSYEEPSDYAGNNRVTDTFFVVSDSIGDAEIKADRCFLRSDFYEEILVQGKARRKIEEYIVKIPFPELSIEADSENFVLEARLGSDKKDFNKVIEYKVRPDLTKVLGKP